MIAIGIGCRKGCAATAIETLVRHACRSLDSSVSSARLYTIAGKEGETGIVDAAEALGLSLVFLPPAALEKVAAAAQTRSARVQVLFGVPSIAETAALAGAGPNGQLIVSRLASDGATCAIAISAGDGE